MLWQRRAICCTALFVILSATLSDCTVEKRRYTKGYFIAHNKKKNVPRGRQESVAATRQLPADVTRRTAADIPDKTPIASAEPGIAAGLAVLKKERRLLQDTCDVIIMRDGRELRAKVLEISQAEVKYLQCDMADGPTFVSLKSDIFMIRYASGRKEMFEERTQNAVQPVATGGPVSHPDAPLVYVFTITGILVGFGSIPAIVIGNRVLREIRAQPGKYSGEEGVKLAVIISWIKVALLILILVLYIWLLLTFI